VDVVITIRCRKRKIEGAKSTKKGEKQMKKILVAYSTNAGSTVEVAQAVGEELSKDGNQVDVCLIKDITTIKQYNAVVVGAPMIMGWHTTAVSFVKKHQDELSKLPVAYFLAAMSLTQDSKHKNIEISISVDPQLARPPKNPDKLSFREGYATVDNYLQKALKAAPKVKPVSIAFFGGKLDIARLKWWQNLFVSFVVQAKPGDYRNWPFIRQWANILRARL
jgi:menaquinone-dependent protoporphyrinogen IX oxidase